MKKVVIAVVSIVLLIAVIAAFAVFFGNNESNIEVLFNQTVQSLDNDGAGLKDLFLDDAKKYSLNLDKNINELNLFYQGKSTSVDGLKIYHETDNVFRAYATVTTDKDKYFLTISATGSRMVDAKGIKQIVIEKTSTFKGKKVIKKHILNEYVAKARTYGVTVRTPGDSNAYIKENKLTEELIKNKK